MQEDKKKGKEMKITKIIYGIVHFGKSRKALVRRDEML